MSSIDVTRYQIKSDGNVYRRGTLAQLLDQRSVAIDEPTLDCLPRTINPLKFLLDNLFKNNCVIVKIKQKAIINDNNYIKLLSNMQYVLPPEQAALLYIELYPVEDTFTLNKTIEDEDVNGYECVSAQDLIVNNVHESIAVSYVKDNC